MSSSRVWLARRAWMMRAKIRDSSALALDSHSSSFSLPPQAQTLHHSRALSDAPRLGLMCTSAPSYAGETHQQMDFGLHWLA
jgi:hypothetical protein